MSDDQTIHGIYTLEDKIGEGGMACVYLARVNHSAFDYSLLYAYTQVQGETHTERRRNAEAFAKKLDGEDLDRNTMRTILSAHSIPLPPERVAVKVSLSDAHTERFEGEWKNLLCLNHENVVKVYGGGLWNGKPYYAMEFLPNLIPPKQIAQTFTLQKMLEVFSQAGKGLHYLHENGIVHRDIKPDNMVTSICEDGSHITKIADLGIAKNLDATTAMTMTETLMGTPYYMAPEQVRSARSVDRRADIYSFGAAMYSLMLGRPPYHDKTSVYEIIQAITLGERPCAPRQHRADFPEAIANIISCCMAFDPGDRYETMAAVVQDIERYLEEEAPQLLAETVVGEVSPIPSAIRLSEGSYLFEQIIERTRRGNAPCDADKESDAPSGDMKKESIRQNHTLQIGIALVIITLLGMTLILHSWPGSPPASPPTHDESGGSPNDTESYESLLLEGRRALDQEKFERAVALFRKAMDIKATQEVKDLAFQAEAKARWQTAYLNAMKRAETLLADNQWDAAEDAYRDALRVQGYEMDRRALDGIDQTRKHRYETYMSAGREAVKDREWPRAIDAFQQALAVSGYEKDPVAMMALETAREGHQRAKAEAARQTYETAMEQGQRQLEETDYSAAARSFQKALENQPGDKAAEERLSYAKRGERFTALLDEALARFAANDWAAAAREFEKALAIEGFENNKRARLGLKHAREQQAGTSSAKEYESAMREGREALQAKDYARAREAFRKAISVEGRGDDNEARWGLREAEEKLNP